LIIIPNPTSQTQPVVLHDGLYNANAMEGIASAMEISLIGARMRTPLPVRYVTQTEYSGELAGRGFYIYPCKIRTYLATPYIHIHCLSYREGCL
jgi:hypothetical protein